MNTKHVSASTRDQTKANMCRGVDERNGFRIELMINTVLAHFKTVNKHKETKILTFIEPKIQDTTACTHGVTYCRH
jgi:hypothetical protein